MTQISASSENPAERRSKTRIQKENETRILLAALEVFSENGFRGATLDRIAATAKMSKPNLLYYFKNKEEIHVALLTDLLDVWLAPLREISPHGEPADEIGSYIRRKLESSRQFPRESRLFANEMLAGAPHISDFLQSELKQLVDEKAAIFQGWIDERRLAPCDPRHLLFAIWSTTQHYADFSVQVRHVLGLQPGDVSYYEEALSMLETLILSRLVPPASTDCPAGPFACMLFRGVTHRIVRMRGPVAILRRHILAGTLVEITSRDLLHGNAVLDRADIDAQVAADTFLVDHLEAALAIDKIGDRLVRRVLTGDVAPAALDAAVLVIPRLGCVVEVQILPFCDVWHRAAVD